MVVIAFVVALAVAVVVAGCGDGGDVVLVVVVWGSPFLKFPSSNKESWLDIHKSTSALYKREL